LRLRSLRKVWGPVVLAAIAAMAFAAAPVHAEQPTANNPWGDITSVVAGPGLTGGAATGDASLAIAFAGSGSANTVARSDHNHDARYLQLTGGTLTGWLSLPGFLSTAPQGTAPFQVDSSTVVANLNADMLDGHHASDFASASTNFDGRYAPIDHNHDGLYLPIGANFDDRYMPLGATFDDRYMQLGTNFDDRYAPIGINFDDRYMPLSANFDDRYMLLGTNFDDRYAPIGINFDDRYLQLVGGALSGALTAPMFTSTAPQGTAPLEVGSNTLVANLNADKLDGHDASDFVLTSAGGGTYALLNADNAFSGANTFNGSATFGNGVSLVNGGASFQWLPFYTSSTAYSLRMMDTRTGVTRLVVDQNGRIGIGTTSPTFPLHVVGDIRATNLNLSTAVLGPGSFDMSASSDRTFQVTNSGTGLGHLSVEGTVTAGGLSLPTGNGSAKAGNAAIAAGGTTATVATSAVGANSLIFVTPDASRSGCVAAPGYLYVSARSAGTSFTVTVAGAAPGAGESYCFNWFLMN
jgi:hypothetical protein